MSETLIGAIKNLGRDIGASDDAVHHATVMANRYAFGDPAHRYAVSDPREELLIRFTVGSGEWDDQHKYNVLRMKMFKMDGEPDGSHDGVWQPVVGSPQDLFKVPPRPKDPLDQPKGPVPVTEPRAYTKAIWRFGEDESDTVTAVGPAMLHLVPFADGSHIFLVAVAAIITNGTGRYEGAQGVKTALGSTFAPAGANIFETPPGMRFGAVTVETLRIVRKKFIK